MLTKLITPINFISSTCRVYKLQSVLTLIKMEKVPCVVIGGGVVGLAVARAMSLSGVTSIVLEKHSRIGYSRRY